MFCLCYSHVHVTHTLSAQITFPERQNIKSQNINLNVTVT